MAARSSRLFTDLHSPRLSDLVRAGSAGEAAVPDGITAPLVARPVGPLAASSHTARTPNGRLRVTAPRDPAIPANEGFGRVGRFTY